MKVLLRIKSQSGQLVDEQVFDDVDTYSGFNPDHPDADPRIAAHIKGMSGMSIDANLDYASTTWEIEEI